jgi:abequosyltransferase
VSTLLSVCIPAYNRGPLLDQTISSVVSQATEDVSIVVSDNASQDNTAAVVQRWQTRFPRLTSFRWPENVGADRNYLKVIELANSEFCWLLGSDDKLEEGGIAYVLTALRKYEGLAGMSVNRYAYDFHLSKRVEEVAAWGGDLNSDTLLTDLDEIVSLLGDYFGYLSGQIIRKDLWEQVVSTSDLSPYMNAYVHLYVILRMLQRHPRWLYVYRRCVGWRGGNDSFLDRGLYRRLEIDVVGFERIARDVLGKRSVAYVNFISKIAAVYVRSRIISAKFQSVPRGFFVHAFSLCLKHYWRLGKFWIKTFPWFLLPSWFLKALRFIYRKTIKRWAKVPLERGCAG